VDETLALLARGDYVADRALATAVHLALKMQRPLFLEGEAGVGKTEIAKVLSKTLGRRMVRLQCYDGLDLASALYDWNYTRQLLEIRLAEAAGERDKDRLARGIFDRRFLIERPLLQAISPEGGPAVLLIDELDRADEPFEAFLLELLADWQVTIPELGTIRAAEPPVVVITSNRTREIHDALRRRCLYHWVDFPDAARERAILALKAPQASERLSLQVVAFVQRLRQMDLFKLPGVAETIDWCGALAHLDATELDPQRVDETLGVLLKYQDDVARIRGEQAAALVAEAKAG
jgi:MoxR-like ATPase